MNLMLKWNIQALFSIETKRVTIKTGEISKNNLTDSETGQIIS